MIIINLLFWLIIFLFLFFPILKNKYLNYKRITLIKKIEKKRNSRLITMIHRQEILSIIGVPFTRFINIEDSEEILRAIRLTDNKKKIDIILHTPGGLVLAAEQIARAIKKHPNKVRVIIPHYAMSGGTLIAMAADEIIMDENAVLGPVDPQIGEYPAVSILKTASFKERADLDDETLILADIADKAIHQLKRFIYRLLKDKMNETEINKIIDNLAEGKYTHDYLLAVEIMEELNISINTNLDKEIYE